MLDYDPQRARAHIALVRRTAREAMTEMRRVLDVLRDEEPRYAPQPGLARLPDLLEEVRAADVPSSSSSRATGRSFRPELTWSCSASCKSR
jgi:hypothetical protein